MENCKRQARLGGNMGGQIRSLDIEDFTGCNTSCVPWCAGDFLYGHMDNTVGQVCTYQRSAWEFPWTVDLATTQAAFKAKFLGVSHHTRDCGACIPHPKCGPYSAALCGTDWWREYPIVDALGAAASIEYQIGDMFTVAPIGDPAVLANQKLSGYKVMKTTDAAVAMFRAYEASCNGAQSTVRLEFLG